MKFSEFYLEPVSADTDDQANGSLRFSFEVSGVKSVLKVVKLWEAGKDLLESLKKKDVNVMALIELVSTIYYSFIKKALK